MLTKIKLLVSSCLLGELVRYDAASNIMPEAEVTQLQRYCQFIAFCPEVAGGLSIPRPAAEIIYPRDQSEEVVVKTQQGQDVTHAFKLGADKALKLAQHHGINVALMAANSPSCGNEQTYNGQFNRQLIAGAGITAGLLQQQGIKVFNQYQIPELLAYLKMNWISLGQSTD